jgi:hypothetical protein
MSAAMHTAGQWVLTFDPTYPAELAIDANVNGTTVHIALVHGVATDDETQANAALIVTAPKTLAALRELLAAFLAEYPAYEAGQEAQNAWSNRRAAARDNARAAIAAAEGRQS